MPFQARGQFMPQLANNGYTSSSELSAQHGSPHQKPKREKDHTCKSCACLAHVSWHDAMWLQRLLRKKEFLTVPNGFTLAGKNLDE